MLEKTSKAIKERALRSVSIIHLMCMDTINISKQGEERMSYRKEILRKLKHSKQTVVKICNAT